MPSSFLMISTTTWALRLLSERHSSIRTRSPTEHSPYSSCAHNFELRRVSMSSLVWRFQRGIRTIACAHTRNAKPKGSARLAPSCYACAGEGERAHRFDLRYGGDVADERAENVADIWETRTAHLLPRARAECGHTTSLDAAAGAAGKQCVPTPLVLVGSVTDDVELAWREERLRAPDGRLPPP